jgi:hypothetical protein
MASIEASSFDFPHPVLTKIGDNNTEPTFASIPIAHVELNANVASIYSARGGGLHGHLALTIAANDYIERSLGNKPFEPPTAPPAFPSHSDTASDAQIAETNRQHKAKKEEFILYHNADTRHSPAQPPHHSGASDFFSGSTQPHDRIRQQNRPAAPYQYPHHLWQHIRERLRAEHSSNAAPMETTHCNRGFVSTAREWSLLRYLGKYRKNRSFRYCLSRMESDGFKHQ